MLKRVVLFTLAISILVFSSACVSERAEAYKNGAETGATSEMTGSVETAATSSASETPDTADGIEKVLTDEIAATDAAYSAYDSDIFGADYDGDGKTEYFIVFTKKGSKQKDNIDCSADIWLGEESGVKRVAEWQGINPDTYGSLVLAGKYYFRYDLAFATEQQTILLSVKDGDSVENYNCLGFADFSGNNDDFTVTSSTYDMVYLKSDDLTCGHTWKNYNFYADAKGFHEYGAVKITEKEFLRYPGADKIIGEINAEHGKEGTTVKCEFLKRCNGLIHINIDCETKDDITHYFRTYKITGDNSLAAVESGEGSYSSALSDLAVYK